MKLILLGTTGYHPSDLRQTACFMIPEMGIVLDAGTAMYRVRNYLATPELDIYLTHAHLDHVVGITYLFDVVRDKSLERVTVHAAPDKLAAIEEHLLAEALFPARPPCEFRPLEQDAALAGGGRLHWFPVEHPGGVVGLRLDWPGHSLAYVTDTMATPDACYRDAIRGVDLLLHECYFSDSMGELAALTGHSMTTPVAELARDAGVGRLVLVHLNPSVDQSDETTLRVASAIFPPTVVARDLMEIEF